MANGINKNRLEMVLDAEHHKIVTKAQAYANANGLELFEFKCDRDTENRYVKRGYEVVQISDIDPELPGSYPVAAIKFVSWQDAGQVRADEEEIDKICKENKLADHYYNETWRGKSCEGKKSFLIWWGVYLALMAVTFAISCLGAFVWHINPSSDAAGLFAFFILLGLGLGVHVGVVGIRFATDEDFNEYWEDLLKSCYVPILGLFANGGVIAAALDSGLRDTIIFLIVCAGAYLLLFVTGLIMYGIGVKERGCDHGRCNARVEKLLKNLQATAKPLDDFYHKLNAEKD